MDSYDLRHIMAVVFRQTIDGSPQASSGHPGVSLGGLDVRVTEDPLDLIEIHAGIDQAGSCRVPEGVDHELRILYMEGILGLVPEPRAVEQGEMSEFRVRQNGCCSFR